MEEEKQFIARKEVKRILSGAAEYIAALVVGVLLYGLVVWLYG